MACRRMARKRQACCTTPLREWWRIAGISEPPIDPLVQVGVRISYPSQLAVARRLAGPPDGHSHRRCSDPSQRFHYLTLHEPLLPIDRPSFFLDRFLFVFFFAPSCWNIPHVCFTGRLTWLQLHTIHPTWFTNITHLFYGYIIPMQVHISRSRSSSIVGLFGLWQLATPKVGYVIVFSVVVWFPATTMAYHTFLALCVTCHRLIFVSNFATSVASILLATLSMTATVCQRSGMPNYAPTKQDATWVLPPSIPNYKTLVSIGLLWLSIVFITTKGAMSAKGLVIFSWCLMHPSIKSCRLKIGD
jgi:hypothetical protein